MKPKLLLALVAFATVGYFIFTGKQQEAQRSDALPSVAADLGLTHSASASLSSLSATKFPLFLRGEDVQVSNVMAGKAGDDALTVFDLGYRSVNANNEIAGNENPNRMDQTAVLLKSATPIPDFVLRPTSNVEQWVKAKMGEGMALVNDKAGDRIEMAADQLGKLKQEVRGYTNRIDPRVSGALKDIADFVNTPNLTDINFDSNTGFSDKYLLTGTDEFTVRQAFTPAVMDHLASMASPLSVEARGGELLAYRGGEFMSTDGMEGFISQVKTLKALMGK